MKDWTTIVHWTMIGRRVSATEWCAECAWPDEWWQCESLSNCTQPPRISCPGWLDNGTPIKWEKKIIKNIQGIMVLSWLNALNLGDQRKLTKSWSWLNSSHWLQNYVASMLRPSTSPQKKWDQEKASAHRRASALTGPMAAWGFRCGCAFVGNMLLTISYILITR